MIGSDDERESLGTPCGFMMMIKLTKSHRNLLKYCRKHIRPDRKNMNTSKRKKNALDHKIKKVGKVGVNKVGESISNTDLDFLYFSSSEGSCEKHKPISPSCFE